MVRKLSYRGTIKIKIWNLDFSLCAGLDRGYMRNVFVVRAQSIVTKEKIALGSHVLCPVILCTLFFLPNSNGTSTAYWTRGENLSTGVANP